MLLHKIKISSFFILLYLFLVTSNNPILANPIPNNQSPTTETTQIKTININSASSKSKEINEAPTEETLITSNETNLNKNDYFVKVYDQVIPLESNYFAQEKNILVYYNNISNNYSPDIENIYICFEDKKQINDTWSICNLTKTLTSKKNIKKQKQFILNKQKLREYLNKLKDSSKQNPENAQLTTDPENNKIIVAKKEKNGYEIDIEKTISKIKQYIKDLSHKKIIELPIKITKPTITSTNYKDIGIKEKIGYGESNFRGSPKNRIHNIHTATKKFEGITVAPGETFSFVKTLGEVNADTGYKEELVIKNHKTFPEFGGGICQVSTTMFRAAVKSGLKITERRNHAYPVQYYSPQGTDATVYIPKPDLQFINNTPGYIFIQPHFSGTILTFDIFGTSDGRQVETEGPILLKRTPDGGRKYVWWQIIKDKDGNQIAKNGFWSFYHNAASYHNNPTQILTSKPKNWSSKEWQKYKREHGM